MKIIGKFPSTRLRRVRNSQWIRRLVSENSLSSNDLILPIFIREGKNIVQEIKSMPGIYRYSIDRLDQIMNKAVNLNIPMVALFPHTPVNKKTFTGIESLNEDNLVCKAIKKIKKKYKNLKLVILGEGELQKNLMNKVKKMNLEKDIEFLGYKENVFKYYKNAFCFVLTSAW